MENIYILKELIKGDYKDVGFCITKDEAKGWAAEGGDTIAEDETKQPTRVYRSARRFDFAPNLTSCPFCGEAPVVRKSKNRFTKNLMFSINCVNEDCIMSKGTGYPYITIEEATDAWNKRVRI